MKDKTERLFEQVSAGFSNRCVELVRAGRSEDAARLHALHRKTMKLVAEWQDDEAARSAMTIAPKPWPITKRAAEWPAPPPKVVARG